MSYPPTCNRCAASTFIIFDGLPWCRPHFLERTADAPGTGDSGSSDDDTGQVGAESSRRVLTRHDDAPSHVLS